MRDEFVVTGIAYRMYSFDAVTAVSSDASRLTLSAGARTDSFHDPAGTNVRFDAPMLLCSISGDFQLTARVSVEFSAAFDAGALIALADDANWAKLCFEYSTERRPRVVSVVTHGRSDDASGFHVRSPDVLLQMTRRGAAMAFHATRDDGRSELVRHFEIAEARTPLQVGFAAQSPNGEGCRATFETCSLVEGTVTDLRSGE
jgi:uncharacterized protein